MGSRRGASGVIDVSGPRIWDASTVATLDAMGTTCAAQGKTATIIGPKDDSNNRSNRCINHNHNERHHSLTGPLDIPPSEYV